MTNKPDGSPQLDPIESWWKNSKDSFLFAILVSCITVAGGFWHFIQAPLQAQIIEDMKIINEMPAVKIKLDYVEQSVKEMKRDHRDFKRAIDENNSLLRELLKKNAR